MLSLLLLALTFFFFLRTGLFVRIKVADMGEEYRSTFSPQRNTWGAMGAARRFIRSSSAFQPIAPFINSKAQSTVSSPQWAHFFSEIQRAAAHPLGTGYWAESDGAGRAYFHASEPFFAETIEDMGDNRLQLYIKRSTQAGPEFLDVLLLDPVGAVTDPAPQRLVYPYRHLALFPLPFLLLLFLFPRRNTPPPGALTYPRLSTSLIPDIVGLIGAGVFFALPFAMVLEIEGNGRILDFHTGYAYATLFFWSLAFMWASALYWTAKYSSFYLSIQPEGVRVSRFGKEYEMPFHRIDTVEFKSYRPPRGLLPLLAVTNPRLAGHALLLAGRKDWGLCFRLTDGSSVKLLCSNIPGIERLFRTLRAKRVKLSPELEDALAEAGL